MKTFSHWKTVLSKRTQHNIIILLSEKGPLRFTELLNEFQERARRNPKKYQSITEPALSNNLKILESEEKIDRFWDKSRNATCYRINPANAEKVAAETSQYEAIEFIEHMRSPVHVYEKRGDVAVAAFMSLQGGQQVYVLQFERYHPYGSNEYITITRKAYSIEKLLPSVNRLIVQMNRMPKVGQNVQDWKCIAIREKELWK